VKGEAVPHLTKGLAALVVASLALTAVACNKGPAQEALEETDRALAAARPDLERYAPEELAGLTAAVRDARSQFEEGRYTDALKAAQDLPFKVQLALGAAAVMKSGLATSWKEMSATVPGLVQAIEATVAELAAAKRLPKGMDDAAFAAARTDLGSVAQAWSEATAAFQGGDVPRAVRTARDVKAKAEALAGMLGLAVAPAEAAPAPAAPAPATPAP
jgi:hypothetical protein